MSTHVMTIVLYVVLVLAVLGGIGAIAYFTSGFSTDFKTFYLTLGSDNIMSSYGGLELESDQDHTFGVKYTFGKLSKIQTGYSIEISPYVVSNDFEFVVDGEHHWYSELKDLTDCFDILYNTDSFTLRGDLSVLGVLEHYYQRPVEILEPLEVRCDYYTMTVYSYNKKASVTIYFHGTDPCQEIIIEPDPIVF